MPRPRENEIRANMKFGNYLTRQNAAYLMMLLFVVCIGIGAFLIYIPAGFISIGFACGLYAYLLGSD